MSFGEPDVEKNLIWPLGKPSNEILQAEEVFQQRHAMPFCMTCKTQHREGNSFCAGYAKFREGVIGVLSVDKTEQILQERGKRYGKFKEHARITQNIKSAMVDSPNWATLPPEMKETLEMNAHKMGRILNGDPFYDDSWQDMIGYDKLVLDIIHESATEVKK